MVRTTPAPRYDIAAIVPEIAELAKVTVRLHPRPGPEPAVNASKLGGRFLWPADEEWPRCTEAEPPQDGWPLDLETLEPPTDLSMRLHEHFYVPILQLRRDEFPELQFPEGKDLFQLLWCPNDHFWQMAPVCKVFWRAEAKVGKLRPDMPQPAPVEQEYLPRPCELHPERVVEYPHQSDLPEAINDVIEQWESTLDGQQGGVYFYELSTATGTKLGGHPRWIQSGGTPACQGGHSMEHLVTVASWEFSGRGERWCPIQDLEHAEFTADDAGPKEARRSTSIMLGDVGSLYLFICRRCEGWPIDSWVEMC